MLSGTLMTLVYVASSAASPSGGAAPKSTAPAPRDLVAETDAWHEQRLARLKAEDGWLSLVGLHWLEEGDNAAGAAEGVPVQLPASAPQKLGTFTRKGLQVTFIPAQGVEVTVGDKRFAGGEVKTDAAGAPDVLKHGTLQLLAIVRGDRVGIRVRDAAAPTRTGFKGIDRFPVRAEWRKDARFEPATTDKKIAVPNVLGTVEDMPHAGTVVFTHQGQELRLDAVKEGEKLFIIFGDASNKTDTYGAGRFLYAELPKDGRVTLDFNRAYNPPCAFTSFATCPLPPKQNRLAIRIDAGEKRYGDH